MPPYATETEDSPSLSTNNGSSESPGESLREKLMRQWAGLKFADTALQIEKDGRRQQIVERLIKKTQDGTLGTSTNEPYPDDEMVVNVGDKVENHYHGAPPSKASGTLGKVLTGAALVAGGAGAALAAPLILDAFRPNPTPPHAHVDTDTDTQYSIGILRDPVSNDTP